MQPLNTTHIRADHHSTIELHPDHWTLVRDDGLTGGRTAFEATQGGDLTYPADFADLHKLPVDGLPLGAVSQVLLGWSPRIAAWQLGLLFHDDFATQRGSRWLELARWHDPDGALHSLTANRAGSALSRVMRLPFKVIPPKLDDALTQVAPPKPLPALPLSLGDWTLERDGDGLLLVRQGGWTRTRFQRIAWYGFWLFAYTAVSVLSLTVKLNLPTAGTLLPMPTLLPYMGLAVAIVLVYLLAKNIRELVVTPNRVKVSSTMHDISALRGESVVWTVAGRKLAGVVVSEVSQQRRLKRLLQHVEIQVMSADGAFTRVLTSEGEHEVHVHTDLRRDGQVAPLLQDDVQTPSQAAAVYIAGALGDLPSYLDQRLG